MRFIFPCNDVVLWQVPSADDFTIRLRSNLSFNLQWIYHGFKERSDALSRIVKIIFV